MSHKLYCALSHEHTFFFVHTRSMYIGDFENWRMWYHGRDIDFDPDVMKAPTGLCPPLRPPSCTPPISPSVALCVLQSMSQSLSRMQTDRSSGASRVASVSPPLPNPPLSHTPTLRASWASRRASSLPLRPRLSFPHAHLRTGRVGLAESPDGISWTAIDGDEYQVSLSLSLVSSFFSLLLFVSFSLSLSVLMCVSLAL